MNDEIPRFTLAAEDFPVAIEYFEKDTGKILHIQVVAEPGVFSIPTALDLGATHPLDVRIRYGAAIPAPVH